MSVEGSRKADARAEGVMVVDCLPFSIDAIALAAFMTAWSAPGGRRPTLLRLTRCPGRERSLVDWTLPPFLVADSNGMSQAFCLRPTPGRDDARDRVSPANPLFHPT